MIGDLKLGYRILRYGYGMKSNCVGALFVLGCGILYYVIGVEDIGNPAFVSSMMLMCAAMLPAQQLSSLNITIIVQASPAGKRLQTSVAALISCAGMMAVYLAVALVQGIWVLICPERLYLVCNNLLIQALCSMGIMLYMGFACKYFVASTMVMVPFMCFGVFYGRLADIFHDGNIGQGGMAFGTAVLLGAALILLGGLVQYLASLLVYRAPMSKMAQAASLRKLL